MTNYRFVTGNGEVVQGWEAIVPILRLDHPRKLTCIGTGFFIHTGGLLVTAAHVIRDVIDATGQPLASLLVFQYVHPNKLIQRPIIKVTTHTVHDVAVAGLATMHHRESSAPLRSKVLTMTTATPHPGHRICSWAFPETVHEFEDNRMSIKLVPKLYDGEINGEHLHGRDKVMLPGRCYETSLPLKGGSSGGPVFDEDGRVFAVNSTGLEGTSIGYVSHIQSIGGLLVSSVKTTDGEHHDNITIAELIRRGEIPVFSPGPSA